MAKKNSPHHFQTQPGSSHDTEGSSHDAKSDDEHYTSKSQAKREVEALQKLGEKLVQLSRNTLEKFDLDERLRDEILFAQTIKSHSAHRRQMQLIGKLMRHADSEAISNQYKRYQNQLGEQNAAFHALEHWRDRLLTEGDKAINELVAQHPDFERTRLRQLLRNAKKEAETNKPPKSARQIFQYLKDVIGEAE